VESFQSVHLRLTEFTNMVRVCAIFPIKKANSNGFLGFFGGAGGKPPKKSGEKKD
jgi:hypothetical protein